MPEGREASADLPPLDRWGVARCPSCGAEHKARLHAARCCAGRETTPHDGSHHCDETDGHYYSRGGMWPCDVLKSGQKATHEWADDGTDFWTCLRCGDHTYQHDDAAVWWSACPGREASRSTTGGTVSSRPKPPPTCPDCGGEWCQSGDLLWCPCGAQVRIDADA